MKHVMRWLGRLENSYRDLRPNPVQFVTVKGTSARVPSFPADMDRVRFHGMEHKRTRKTKRLAVTVENIKLPYPVLVDSTGIEMIKDSARTGSSLRVQSSSDTSHD